MEALLQSLAAKYGYDVAVKLLGIDKQTQNPKYAISMGGNTLDIGNMAKRGLLNRGINSITSGGMLGPGLLLGGALGLGYLTNPLREGSFNYNPNLKGQIDYASGKGYIGKNSNTGLMQYGPGSVLRGQNVVSGFGTNDYQGQLQNKIDYFENRIALGKPISQKNYEKALEEKADLFEEKQTIQENYRTGLQGAGGNVGTTDFTAADDNRENYGKNTGDGGSNSGGTSTGRGREEDDKMARGGIAGINRNRGQLGETLYG